MKTRRALAAVAAVVASGGLLGACAVPFSEKGYRVTDDDGGSSCDETAWACTNDQTYCSCAFVTPAQAEHLKQTSMTTPTCNNDAFNGVTWACWATATACNCGPATSTAPVRLANATTVNTCCGAAGSCTQPPAGMKAPITCP